MPFDRLNSLLHLNLGIYPTCLHRFGSLLVLAANFAHQNNKMYHVLIDHFFRNALCRVLVLSTPSLLCDISNLDYV